MAYLYGRFKFTCQNLPKGVYEARQDALGGFSVFTPKGDQIPAPMSFETVQKNIASGYWTIVPEPALVPTLSAACEAYTAACVRFETAQAELDRAKQAVADARIDVARALENEP